MYLLTAQFLQILISALGLFGWLAVIILTSIYLDKKEKLRTVSGRLQKIENAFDELDEQAKLIVKTDLELNKTQEELDRKASGLSTLQRISRAISRTFDKEEIFSRIEKSFLEDLGFDRVLIFSWENDSLLCKTNINYEQEQIKSIIDDLKAQKERDAILVKLKQGKTIVKTQSAKGEDAVKKIFGLEYYILSPIQLKETTIGFIVAGNNSQDYTLSEGDTELVKILSTQIGEALENAELFEETWKARQELETNVKLRTKELSEALDEIKQISKRKSDFISAVSHELRTPLTSIKGYASILLTGKLGDIPEAVKERLEKVNRHSDDLTQLINDLLDISRIESGRVELKLEDIDVTELVNQTLDMLSPQIKEKQLRVQNNLNKQLAKIKADRSQITRVFINLLGNAIKFTPASGSINVEAKTVDKFMQIDISDTGMGIPEKDINHIFDEFYRAQNAIDEQTKGSGLGLSLVKYIILVHKGNIWVTSTLDKGSKFSFTLPLA
jgi:signal transduction histidine kinase